MAEAFLLAAAQLICICGFGWLALAMRVHWRQVRGMQPLRPGTARALRVMGGAALLASLLIFLRVDHVSMAVLAWVMSMSASVLLLAFTLAWRPRLLVGLVAWVRDTRLAG